MSTIMIINIVIVLISLLLVFLFADMNNRVIGNRFWWVAIVFAGIILILSLTNLYLIDIIYVIEV